MNSSMLSMGLAVAVVGTALGQITWGPANRTQPPATSTTPPPPRNVPIRISVEPGKKTDTDSPATTMRLPGSTTPGSGLPGDLPNTTALYFHVKLANVSPRSLTNLTARWSLLWMDHNNAYHLSEGQETCAIAPARQFEFDTKPVSLRPGSKEGKISLIEKASVLGYMIEVLQTNAVIASDCKPADIAPLVLQLRTK